jgi:hypothetical protein
VYRGIANGVDRLEYEGKFLFLVLGLRGRDVNRATSGTAREGERFRERCLEITELQDGRSQIAHAAVEPEYAAQPP